VARRFQWLLACGLICALAWVPPTAIQADSDAGQSTATFAGHAKYRLLRQTFPQGSAFREVLGGTAVDQYLESRLKLGAARGQWDFKADYQLIALHSDTLQLAQDLPGLVLPGSTVINDDRRWWNLTYSFGDGQRTATVHRLDRLNVGFSTERTVWRFGRQAISWGNGLLFTPMDIFNPFDPAAVDKEYKPGDDMLYGQYLFADGSDVQGVAVVRRNPVNGEVEHDQSSAAVKYHGFAGMNGFDLLVARHFGDRILGLGGDIDLGGAVWRGDITWTDTDRDDIWSGVTSLSYSWVWGGRNVSGLLEYFYNGFGLGSDRYAADELLRNPDLLRRIARGELFTLARHYLGASVTIEMTPLFLLTPNLFVNLQDPSALAQLVAQYSVKQDLVVLGAVGIPIGPTGSEFGGIDAPAEGRHFSTGTSLFAQLAWYF
jgi:hypothetical protein